MLKCKAKQKNQTITLTSVLLAAALMHPREIVLPQSHLQVSFHKASYLLVAAKSKTKVIESISNECMAIDGDCL